MQLGGVRETLSLADGGGDIAIELKTMMVLRLQATFGAMKMCWHVSNVEKNMFFFPGGVSTRHRRNLSPPQKLQRPTIRVSNQGSWRSPFSVDGRPCCSPFSGGYRMVMDGESWVMSGDGRRLGDDFLSWYFGPIRGARLDSLDFSGEISPMLLTPLDLIRPLSSPIII